ncbi:hypothetical protein CPB83DRAFT_185036 [Crepidotus variabilis]|uniref:Uncharacterized protein n=1 Tax=Crepidotus variabilis TaxID=179855 RepID=A0A9P6E3A2_9AGAR|nr:hypothetical protein CPB83DRAFT_185036 [Crepidotus variabilis]
MNGLVVSSLEAYHLRQLLDSQDSLNLTLETLRTRLSTNSDTQIPSAEEDFTITSREEPSSLAVVTVSCPIQQSASSCSDSASPTLAPSSPRLSPSDKDGDKGSGFSTAEKSTLAAGSSMNPDVSMDNVSTTSTPSSPTSFFTWSLETGETSNQDYVSGTKSGLKRSCPWGSDAEEEQGNYGYDDEEEGEDEGTGPANRMRGGAKICPRKSRALRSAPKTTIERRLLSRGGPEGLGNQNDLEDIRMQHDPPPAVLNGAAVSSGEHSQIAPGMESLNCVPAIPDPPIPENPVLNTAAITFISAIASVCRDFVHDAAGHVGIVTSVPALMQSLLSVESAIVIDDSSAPEMNGLIRLAVSCIAAEVDEAEAHLHYYLSSMMFASGINRCTIFPSNLAIFHLMPNRELQKPNTYKYQLLDQIASKVKFRRRSGKIASYTGRGLERYLADGIKVAALCAAGSFNMVIFLSCTRMRAELRKIPAEIFLRLTKAIRCPPNSALGRLIARDVITAVQYSFQLYLIKLHMLFPTRFLEQKYGSSIVDCTDLCATDEILEGFFFNDFVKVRDLEAWKPALQPLQPASNPTAWILPWTLPSIHSSPRASDLVVINTNYDPTLNTKTFYPKTQQGRFDYTEEQRKYVSQAASCSSIDDFREKISKQLQTAVDGQMVRLNDVNQNLLALIVATMPLDLRARLLDIVNLSFAQGLRFVDSKLEGFLNIHHSVHLSRYNRFAFQVCSPSPS